MPTTRKAKYLRLMPEDLEIMARLRRHYGLGSDNEVMRMALRAAQRELERAEGATKSESEERPSFPPRKES